MISGTASGREGRFLEVAAPTSSCRAASAPRRFVSAVRVGLPSTRSSSPPPWGRDARSDSCEDVIPAPRPTAFVPDPCPTKRKRPDSRGIAGRLPEYAVASWGSPQASSKLVTPGVRLTIVRDELSDSQPGTAVSNWTGPTSRAQRTVRCAFRACFGTKSVGATVPTSCPGMPLCGCHRPSPRMSHASRKPPGEGNVAMPFRSDLRNDLVTAAGQCPISARSVNTCEHRRRLRQ